MKYIIIFVYCILSIVPLIHADIYSWVDKNGVKVFSNQKPPKSADKSKLDSHKEFKSGLTYQPAPANYYQASYDQENNKNNIKNQHRLDLILKDMVRKYNGIAEKWAKEDIYQNYWIASIFNSVSMACELRIGGGSEKNINEAKDNYRKAVSIIDEIKDCTRYVRRKKYGKLVKTQGRACIESKINIAEALIQQGNIQLRR